eukprot:2808501-Pleurochrysis_carterae.AAC.6
MRFSLGALQAAAQLVEVVQLHDKRPVGQARAIGKSVASWYSPALRKRSKLFMIMSLPRREASTASQTPRLTRSRSASFRARSSVSSFLSRVKHLMRSLAGGHPSVCMTRSWPAYAGR